MVGILSIMIIDLLRSMMRPVWVYDETHTRGLIPGAPTKLNGWLLPEFFTPGVFSREKYVCERLVN